MAMNRKGYFYFFVALVFVMGIGAAYFFTNSYQMTDSQEATSVRIYTIDNFINDLRKDAGKASYIAAYRGLIAMEEEISNKGDYFTDAEAIFEEVFLNGSINGVPRAIMNASSFSDYIERVKATAASIGISLDVRIKSFSLRQETPWSITVKVNFTNNMTDDRGVASWVYEEEQERRVPIFDLRDPIYSVGTEGRVPNVIRKTNYSYFIYDVDNANDTANLLGHTNESFYIATELAPDYLMRLEGNFSNSSAGIESIVNIPEAQSQGIVIDGSKSILDHHLFNPNSSATGVCDDMINMPSWFRIKEEHIALYEIDPKLGPENEGYTCI